MFQIAQIVAVFALVGAAFGGVISAPLVAGPALAAPLVASPALAAPLVAPTVGYAHGIPQNVAPYASSINIVNRGASLPYTALPYSALPYPAFSPYVSAVSPFQRYALPAPYAAVL